MKFLAVGFAIVTLLAGLAGGLWATAAFVFAGKDHSRYDQPRPPLMRAAESPEHKALIQQLKADAAALASGPQPGQMEMIRMMRRDLDARGEAVEIEAEVTPVDVDGVPAEWVVELWTEPNRRILYLHGGGFFVGSPKSHRPIAARLSGIMNAAVLVIDYRLMPEHSRMDGIEDARKAYNWITLNGPKGPAAIDSFVIAGDSAGGNLALSLAAWARDEGRETADAVIVMSPQTDQSLTSPSLRSNLERDLIVGPALGPVAAAPRPIGLWMMYGLQRINPSDPTVSPLMGDLSGLPPTLIQVSNAEMFFDDGVRYANKARAQGSPVTLQVWPGLVHVWHAFDVPETDEAFEAISDFIGRYAP